jgi:acyl carrier protein
VVEISPTDNFYALGGDSVKSVLLLFSIRDEFDVVLENTALMKYPTLRDFSLLVAEQLAGDSGNAGESDEGVI